MLTVIVTILIIGVILFISSFFMNNRFDELNQQIEQLSISTMQDSYVIKNKLKVLEEELMSEPIDITTIKSKHNEQNITSKEPAIVKNVKNLHEQGYSISQIEKHTGLRQEDIKIIVNQTHTNEPFK